MPWPPIQDFTRAVQTPKICFEGLDLADGKPELDPRRGTPLVYSGSFAAVYPVECGGEKYAIRCFTKEVKDQQQRYDKLSGYLQQKAMSELFSSFEYLEQGIRVNGEWYPVVRMKWVEGKPLDKFVEDNLKKPDSIRKVCARWRDVNNSLRRLRIAHNDLQHGNIMVQGDGAIRLVDYDGIFLPEFQGQPSPEVGHRHYQHPMRKSNAYYYGDYVDNFPSLVIYLSLLALSKDPDLWGRFNNADNLILRESDYVDPANSECIRDLKKAPDHMVQYLAGHLEDCCSMPVDQVPNLWEILRDATRPPSASVPSPTSPGKSTSASPRSPRPPIVGLPWEEPPEKPTSANPRSPRSPRSPARHGARIWPPIQDFTNAVQTPKICFEGLDLADGKPELDPRRGTPLVYSGSFAAVYPVECGGEKYAIRCFTKEVKDQQQRYDKLSGYLQQKAMSELFSSFEYLEQGIRVNGEWYPVVRMKWVEGKPLDKFVEDNLKKPDSIRKVCARWRDVNNSLRRLRIAHNDLQHGNIMVQGDGAIRLVDYDGIFLPEFQGQPSPEVGHRHYQHPMRKSNAYYYGDYVDNFPSLVIYLSLLALSKDPDLWGRFNNADNLILRESDYVDPANSECILSLKKAHDHMVQYLVGRLENCCSMPVDQVPNLWEILRDATRPPSASVPSHTSPGKSTSASPRSPRPPIVGLPWEEPPEKPTSANPRSPRSPARHGARIWPPIQDFTNAVQTPKICFEGLDLADGKPELDPRRGTPLVYSGSFAAVYPVECGGEKYAIRCFTREVKDQQQRYDKLSKYLQQKAMLGHLPYLGELSKYLQQKAIPGSFSSFNYLEQGIRVKGEWYPVVLMKWVEGKPLDQFVEDNLKRPDSIRRVYARWRGVNNGLRRLGIAHNDLHHGNVVVQGDGTIRLVDYDCIFLPDFQGQPSPELGHPNYQHPMRKSNAYYYGDYVDNFPSLVIYLSLLALSKDPDHWERFNNGDNLILRESDYVDPASSECIRSLKKDPLDPMVRYLAGRLEDCCSMPVDQVPNLWEILRDADRVAEYRRTMAQPSNPPPRPAAPSQTVVGGGSEYRKLLQIASAGSAATVSSPPASAPAAGGGTPASVVSPPPIPEPPASAPAAGGGTPASVVSPPPIPEPPVPAPAAGGGTPASVVSLPPAPAVSPVMICPQCSMANPVGLIYCDDEKCAADLEPGNKKFCAYCGKTIPARGSYCPWCGRANQ